RRQPMPRASMSKGMIGRSASSNLAGPNGEAYCHQVNARRARPPGTAIGGTNGCGAEIRSAIAHVRLQDFAREPPHMSIDAKTVRRIAHLARIAVAEDEVGHLQAELNAFLAFVEQLKDVNVDGVEPMTSVTPMVLKTREDVITDGGIPDDIVKNAPASEDHFFLVPKVVE